MICVTDVVCRDDESDGWIRRRGRYREHVLQDDGGDGQSMISTFVHDSLNKLTDDDVQTKLRRDMYVKHSPISVYISLDIIDILRVYLGSVA
jgi:hypothetical protein